MPARAPAAVAPTFGPLLAAAPRPIGRGLCVPPYAPGPRRRTASFSVGFLGAGTSSSRESTGCRVSAITLGLAADSSTLFFGLPCLMYEPLSATALEPGAALSSANWTVTIRAIKKRHPHTHFQAKMDLCGAFSGFNAPPLAA